jgi:polyphosphate kinase
VRSIVGRFLEHSRVYYFANDGQREIYCGSADWMDRNLFRRVEVAFPVESAELQERVAGELDLYVKDDVQAWQLGSDGLYVRVPGGTQSCAQSQLLARYCEPATEN